MKIAFINIYQGLAYRGAERSTEELCLRLGVQNRITLISAGNTNVPEKVEKIKIPILLPYLPDSSFSFFRRFYLDLWSLQILIFTLRCLPYLLKRNFDILIPVNGGWQTVIIKLVTRIKRSKMVVIGRAGIGRDDAWNLLTCPDLFIALTGKAEKWAGKIKPGVKIVRIPNGIDLEKFHPRVKPVKLDLPRPVILAVSALTENKRLKLTINAVAAMEKPVSLLIVGRGPLKESLQNLGRQLLGRDRFMITQAGAEDMPVFYTAADIFTMVSVDTEAFGNVYLEALACNLPVAAPDDENRREIIGPAGLYCDPRDPRTYAQVLEEALSRNLGNIPRSRAEQFDWKRIIKKYDKVLKQLMKR